MKHDFTRLWITSYLIALVLVPVIAILCSLLFNVNAWLLGVVLFIFAPIVPLLVGHFAWRREARQAQSAIRGICSMCGYNRKGLNEGARCPECGARA